MDEKIQSTPSTLNVVFTATHISGLPIGENDICYAGPLEDKYVFKSGTLRMAINRSRVQNISIIKSKKHTVTEHFLSAIVGAILVAPIVTEIAGLINLIEYDAALASFSAILWGGLIGAVIGLFASVCQTKSEIVFTYLSADSKPATVKLEVDIDNLSIAKSVVKEYREKLKAANNDKSNNIEL